MDLVEKCAPPQEAERLNLLALAAQRAWHNWLPLSVRMNAARAADAIVAAWMLHGDHLFEPTTEDVTLCRACGGHRV